MRLKLAHFDYVVNSFMTEVPIIETCRLICKANRWTGFYMIGTSVMKKLTRVTNMMACDFLETIWLFHLIHFLRHENSHRGCSVKKRCSYKFCNTHRKISVLESLFKKRLQNRCFPVNIVNFFKTLYIRSLMAVNNLLF